MKVDPPIIPDAITIYIIKLNLVNAMFEILKLGIYLVMHFLSPCYLILFKFHGSNGTGYPSKMSVSPL